MNFLMPELITNWIYIISLFSPLAISWNSTGKEKWIKKSREIFHFLEYEWWMMNEFEYSSIWIEGYWGVKGWWLKEFWCFACATLYSRFLNFPFIKLPYLKNHSKLPFYRLLYQNRIIRSFSFIDPEKVI